VLTSSVAAAVEGRQMSQGTTADLPPRGSPTPFPAGRVAAIPLKPYPIDVLTIESEDEQKMRSLEYV